MSLCRKPFHKEGLAFGCGQCLPCRINRRRVWTLRIMLESLMHPDNSFITLTYDNDNLPSDGSLQPTHMNNWIKYLRKYLDQEESGRKIRYYLVGEYGENKGYREVNPHYHIALFNYPSCIYGVPSSGKQCLCPNCAPIYDTWKKGRTFNAKLEVDSAQYIAQYVTKGLSKRGSSDLQGREPEFSRMSNRPGIGAAAIQQIAASYSTSPAGLSDLETNGDVPSVLKITGKTLPLGRYLRQQLRLALGRDPDTPEEVLLKLKLENQALGDDLVSSGLSSNKIAAIRSNKSRIDSMEKKHKLMKKVRLL